MHSSHAVLFDTDVNLPASHSSHVGSPLLAAYEPGRHADGASEPVAHDEPAARVWRVVSWAEAGGLALGGELRDRAAT